MADIKPQNKGKNKGWENLKPCKPGQTNNPNGRPKGKRNFETLFRDAIKRLAESNNTTPDKLEEEIIIKGITTARKGDYRFY